jgi:hypothetical protein
VILLPARRLSAYPAVPNNASAGGHYKQRCPAPSSG